MLIVAALPLIVYLLLWLCLSRAQGRRQAALDAALIFGLLLALSTEMLSLFGLLSAWGVGLFWLLAGQMAVAWLLWRPAPRQPPISTPRRGYLDWTAGFKAAPLAHLSLLGVLLIMALVGLTALMAPPNNWDSMTYHMSRVAHWEQNGSLAHYPTHIIRQLYQHPWAEYAILHLQILSGSDRLANLVQWGGMAGSVLGVMLIAGQLGASQRGRIFAAVLCSTITIGILQASSTQNDYVVAFWGVCLVYALLKAQQEGITGVNALRVGAALGLMLLTKATTYIYALPFMLWFAGLCLLRLRWGAWRPYVIVGVVALLIPAGHYLRNLESFGSPLGPRSVDYTNQVISPAALASNLIRNISLHTYIHPDLDQRLKLDNQVIRFIYDLHEVIGADIDDPRTTWTPNFAWWRPGWQMHEDKAPVPFHLLLVLLTMGLYGLGRRHIWTRTRTLYGLALLGGFLLFCLVLKWQPWGTRLHLPFFVLAAPLMALVLSHRLPNGFLQGIALFLILFSLAFPVTRNISRPLMGPQTLFNTERQSMYFKNRPELETLYLQAIERIQAAGCDEIGLVIGSDDWEYPLWVLAGRGVRIEHVNTRLLHHPHRAPAPCALLHINTETLPNPHQGAYAVGVALYQPAWTQDSVQVLLPVD